MRYLSLIFVLFLMFWTWRAMEAPAVIPDNIHLDVQTDLKRVITQSILEDVPSAENIRFERFWTETLKANKMKASFSYKYDDRSGEDGANIGIDGYALLTKKEDNNTEFETWTVDELYFLNNRVTFKEGVTVRVSENGASAEEPASSPSDNHHNHDHSSGDQHHDHQ